jgi:hypothetical protein
MADNKFGEFGITPTTERATVKIEGAQPTPPAPNANKFGEFGLGGLAPKITMSPEGEAAFSEQEKSGSALRDLGLPLLPIGLGLVGSTAGPAGAAVGAATGQLMRSTLEKGAPLTPWEATKDAVVTGGSTYVGGKALGPLESKLGSAIVAALWGKGVDTAVNGPMLDTPVPEQLGGLLKDIGLNYGLTLATEPIAARMQRKANPAGVPLEQAVGELRTDLTGPKPQPQIPVPTPPKTRTEYARGGQAAIEGNLGKAKAIENRAWDTFRKHATDNTAKLQKLVGYEQSKKINPQTLQYDLVPKIEDIEIKGPITMANSQKLAQDALPDLDAFMKGDSYSRLPDFAKQKYASLYGTLKNVAEGTKIIRNGQEVEVPLKEFETVKDIRTTINQSISGKPDPNFPQAKLKKLAEALGQDVDLSVQNFWKNGPQAMKDLDVANSATRLRRQNFQTSEIMRRMAGTQESGHMDTRVEADPDKFFQGVYKSPEQAARLMTAVGKADAAYIKGDYLDNHLLPKAFGPNYSKFEPSKIINELENPNSSAREILTADERNNILRVMRAARASGQETGEKGNTAMTFLRDQAALNIGIAASRTLVGSSTPIRAAIGIKEFFEYVRNSKPAAEYAQRLLKVRPDSVEGQQAAKLFLRGVKGAIMTVTIDGKDRKAEVVDNGKLKMLGDDQ